jgi:hypothetical protein
MLLVLHCWNRYLFPLRYTSAGVYNSFMIQGDNYVNGKPFRNKQDLKVLDFLIFLSFILETNNDLFTENMNEFTLL